MTGAVGGVLLFLKRDCGDCGQFRRIDGLSLLTTLQLGKARVPAYAHTEPLGPDTSEAI